MVEKYINRLLEEWKSHGKIIIAADWDDTLFPWRLHDKEQMRHIWELLSKCKDTGAYIVIFTACDETRYDEIKNTCKANRLDIDSINENPISLPYGNHKKVYANIFLDDRAGLDEAAEILEKTLYLYRGWKQGQENINNTIEV